MKPTDLIELICSRRTVHRYRRGAVDPAIVEAALRAAHHAPNHKLTWPWRFTWVGDETRADVADICLELARARGVVNDAARSFIVGKVLDPGGLIVVTQTKCEETTTDGRWRSREDYAATCCAIQNLMLAFHAHGVATKWGTGGMTRQSEILGRLGIDGDVESVAGFIWFGEAAVHPQIDRPPVADFVRRLP